MPQLLQHRVDGAAAMQQYRQVRITGDLQLGIEIELLPQLVTRLDKAVKTDFPDRQRLLTLERFTPAGARAARTIGAVVIGAGLVLMARAGGL